MKKRAIQIISLVILSVSFAAVSANAQSGTGYRVDIPFDFNVGKVMFKAGQYNLGIANPAGDPSALTIRDQDNKNTKVIMSLPRSADGLNRIANLVFAGREGRYFLTEIVTPTINATFREPGLAIHSGAKSVVERRSVSISGN